MVNMTSFLGRKNRHKFKVNLRVEELSSVPFVNGVLFAKVRLVNGGNFTNYSDRRNIENNKVRWDSEFEFDTKMTSNYNNAVLDPNFLRISIRKETKGGKSYLKVGYATINLAQYAGAGTTRRYLLEAYNQKKRQDNSMLQVHINMTIIMGDHFFRMPTDSDGRGLPLEDDVDSVSSQGDDSEENSGRATVTAPVSGPSLGPGTGLGLPNTTSSPLSAWEDLGGLAVGPDVGLGGSAGPLDDLEALSDSSGRGSGKHHLRHVSDGADFSSSSLLLSAENGLDNPGPVTILNRGHSRALSSVSAVSTSGVATGPASSTGARTHSRQSSLESCQFNRFPSNSSGLNDRSLDRKQRERKANESRSIQEYRVAASRMDNDEIINQVMSGVGTISAEGPSPTEGNLHLAVARDGTASVISASTGHSSIIPRTPSDIDTGR